MALTEKGQSTRRRILSAAGELFHVRGVNATSVGDVMRASGTGKGQFYQHFASRDDLVAAVFRSHREVLASAPPIESWDELEVWILKFHRAQKAYAYSRGCPIGTTGYSLQPDQDELRELIGESLAAMRGNVANFLRSERAAGRLVPSAEPGRLADFAIATVQGGMLLALVDRRARPILGATREALEHLRNFRVDPG